MAENQETWTFLAPPALNEKLQEQKDENGWTKSETARHFVSEGLEPSDTASNNQYLDTLLATIGGTLAAISTAVLIAAPFIGYSLLIPGILGVVTAAFNAAAYRYRQG